MNNRINFLPGNPNNLLKSTDYITPEVNSLGYRTVDFNKVAWNDSIVIFGCSYVFGVGLSNNETISNQLQELIGRPVINMGVPASSMSYAFFNQLALSNSKPYAVVNLWTSIARQTYFADGVPYHLGPWLERKENSFENRKLKTLFDLFNFDASNIDTYARYIQQATNVIWKDTVHIEGTFFPQTATALNIDLYSIIDKTEDGHPGSLTAKQTAETLAGKIEGS